MNVNDFDIELPKGDKLELIFEYQLNLVKKYHEIEDNNIGIKMTGPVWDINDKRAQYRIKDYAWRVTEELAEATECMDQEDKTHFLEELIDALHFFVEMMIYVGVTPCYLAGGVISHITGKGPDGTVPDLFDSMFKVQPRLYLTKTAAYWVIEEIGLAMNCLKNKPWKQTHMMTDEKEFRKHLVKAFANFIGFLKTAGFTPESAAIMYLKKNEVNQFRIRSKY